MGFQGIFLVFEGLLSGSSVSADQRFDAKEHRVMKRSQGGPASRVMWKLGTHQVETRTPSNAIRPKRELQGPGGAKRRMFFPAREVARRKARCVKRIMIQMK